MSRTLFEQVIHCNPTFATTMLDSHRLFLQSFLSRGMLEGKEVKDLYKYICTRFQLPPDMGNLAEFVLNINSNIKPFHIEIKKGISEHDGKNFYCLVNLEESDISRVASRYSAVELEYFKKLIEEIVCSTNDGSMSSTNALNLTEDLPGGKTMRKKDAEALIEKLSEERWLERNKDGQILLSARTLMEFDHYITEQFPEDSVQCEVCRKLVVMGQSCSQCQVRMHIHCAKKFFRPENPKCPQCKEVWVHDVSKPAKAARTEAEGASQEPAPSQASQAQAGRRSSRRQ